MCIKGRWIVQYKQSFGLRSHLIGRGPKRDHLIKASVVKDGSAKRAAFRLGRHERFALKCLITNSRYSALLGGRTKDRITKRLLHGPLRHRNSPTDGPFQDCRPIDPNTPFCGPALFFLSCSLAVIALLKIYVSSIGY